MTPFEAFEMYFALKQHFTTVEYDYKKYKGKVTTSIKAFEKTGRQIYFDKLAKKTDTENYIVANMLVNPKIFIVELVSPVGEEIYLKWLARQQSLVYNFKQDLEKIDLKALKVVDHQLPSLFKKNLSIETLILVLDAFDFYEHFDVKIHDPTWTKLYRKILKYKPFFTYDKVKIKQIILDKMTNLE